MQREQVIGGPWNRDAWGDVRYECLGCGDEHHPDAREEHAFRLGTRVCPACGSTRARVSHDLTGPVLQES